MMIEVSRMQQLEKVTAEAELRLFEATSKAFEGCDLRRLTATLANHSLQFPSEVLQLAEEEVAQVAERCIQLERDTFDQLHESGTFEKLGEVLSSLRPMQLPTQLLVGHTCALEEEAAAFGREGGSKTEKPKPTLPSSRRRSSIDPAELRDLENRGYWFLRYQKRPAYLKDHLPEWLEYHRNNYGPWCIDIGWVLDKGRRGWMVPPPRPQ